MRPRGAQQVQTVGLGLQKRLLVTKDHILAVFVELPQGDKASALIDLVLVSRRGKALRIGENAGILLLGENSCLPPIRKIPRRARINVVHSRDIEELRKSKNKADQVIGAAVVIRLLHRWRDLVIGLSDDILQADERRVVAQCAERVDASHAGGRAPYF